MVEVVEYRTEWPARFAAIGGAYRAALDAAEVDVVSIEHVGSTSVPGLAAKPVIDVDVVVRRADVDAALAALVGLGFETRGELGVPDRFATAAPPRFAPTNTYVAVEGSVALRNHLAVRDVLRSDDRLRDAYAEVKRAAGAATDDIDKYILAKSPILNEILRAGGLSEGHRAEIARVNAAITARGAAG